MKIFVKILLFFNLWSFALAQDMLSLEQALNKAEYESARSKNIADNFNIRTLEFEIYKKSLLPQVSITAGMPYQRSIEEVVQFDGSSSFIERNFVYPTFSLTTSQILPFTGGELKLTNSINRFDDLTRKTTSYSSDWVNLTYAQTINGFNPYKWQKKRYELLRKKDSLDYKKEISVLKNDVAKIYFDAYLLQIKIDLTTENINKTKLLLSDFKEKLKYGRALKVDVNQVEITLNQLEQRFNSETLELKLTIDQLKYLISYNKPDSLILLPVEREEVFYEKESMIKYILQNNYDLDAQIMLLEADEKIDKAKKDGAINFFVQLGIGLNSTSNHLNELYATPSQKQNIVVGATVPLLNWGIIKNRKKIAQIEKNILERELDNTEFELKAQAENLYNYYLSLIAQLEIAEKQLVLQQETSDLFYEMLLLGRKTFFDYRNQLFEQEKSIVDHHELLKNYHLLVMSIEQIFLDISL